MGILAYYKAMSIQCQEKALFGQKKLYIDTAYIEIIGFSKKPFVEIIPMPPHCQKHHFSYISELN